MAQIKVFHTADWHTEEKAIDEIQKCLFHMVAKAKEEKPDVIAIVGDLFNSYMIKLDSLSAKLVFNVVEQLANIAPVAIVLGTPSHEGSATTALRYIKAKYNVWVSDRPEQIYLVDWGAEITLNNSLDFYTMGVEPKAVISMIPTPTKKYFQSTSTICESDSEIAAAMSGIFAGFGAKAFEFDCPHIVGCHISIGGAYISETQTLIGVDIEITKDQLMLLNADLICGGHIHMAQEIIIIPDVLSFFYSGSLYRKTWGELEEKGFYVHACEVNTSDPGYVDGFPFKSTFHLTPTRKLVKMASDMTTGEAVEDLVNDLCQPTGELIRDAFLRIEIKIYQDEAAKIDQQKMKDFFLSEGAIEVEIKLIRTPRENVRSTRILQLGSLVEKLEEQAKITGATISEGIKAKAIMLQTEDPNEIIKRISEGV